MVDALLQTKLHPPILPIRRTTNPLVLRPRLSQKMDAGTGRKLTLVSSPAGFGKTTFLSEWGRSRPLAWLSLDKADNDPIRFWSYFIAALQRVNHVLGREAIKLLQGLQPPPLEKSLTLLVNDMAELECAEGKPPLTIVLDDYHFIDSTQVHESITFLLAYLPRCYHFIIATRVDPPFPLAHLRGKGELNEIRAAELRFTPEETAVFLTRVMRLNLGTPDIAALHERTEGWIAGLQLAALSLQGQQDPKRFVQNFVGSNRYILDYLVEEVFRQRPFGTRRFLLKTAVLNRFCADLCAALMRDEEEAVDSQSMQRLIERLEASNLFIVPLDEQRSWYRYHHLFADLLRHHMRVEFGKAYELLLHQRASQWFESRGMLEEAIEYALAAADWDRVGTLLDDISEAMLKRSEVATLLRWYKAIPKKEVLRRPRLCYAYSWPLILTGQLETAVAYLDRAEAAAQKDARFLAEVTATQAYCARVRGDFARTVQLSQRALSLLPNQDPLIQGIVTMNLGIARWNQGKIEAAQSAFRDAEDAARLSGNVYSRLTAICYLGRIEAVRGNLHAARQQQQRADELANKSPAGAASLLELSQLSYERNETNKALSQVTSVFDLCKRSGNVDVEVGAHLMYARLEQARGDEIAARDALKQARRLIRNHPVAPVVRARSIVNHVDIALAQEDIGAARQWAAALDELIDIVPLYTLLPLVPIRLLLAERRKSTAMARLKPLFRTARKHGLKTAQIHVLILQSVAAPPGDAGSYFTDALQLAQPQGYIRTFIDSGQPILALLEQSREQKFVSQYATALLDEYYGRKLSLDAQAQLAEPLSERELEVLQQLVAGLTYAEIGQVLFISVNTVKTHLRNVYAKLGVSNRRQAINKARTLGFFP